jgi:hypothetical protein
LQTPLIVGQQYLVTFWVNHADTSQVAWATNNLGIKFSTVAHSLVNPDTALNFTHVFSTTVITDTANWVQIGGSFIADSAYTHFDIGNFFGDAFTDTIRLSNHPLNRCAYYLIDDVCISSDSTICFNNKSSGIHQSGTQHFIKCFLNTSNNLVIQLTENFQSLQIYNVLGAQVFTHTLNEKILELPLNVRTSGMYVLQFNSSIKTVRKKMFFEFK